MPRPRKCRKVCCLPDNDGFVPVRGGEELTPIVLNMDEYEAIRLIDREGFSQEQCGEYMRIARTTVQQIYAAVRKNWPMRWLRDFLCASREGILHSAAETAQPTGAEIAISKKSIRCFRNTSSSGSMSRPKTVDSARL